jgi:clorobiocin biosynthesis protein CloN6
MEAWIERALNYGVNQIDVWYFIGMGEQDERSAMGSLDYARRLLEVFRGQNVNPMICPMIPFLDPASEFFEHPEKHGYRVFHRSVEEHRRGMERASLLNRINYETKWLSRADLVRVGFRAVRELMEAKADMRALPRSLVRDYVAKIDDALQMIGVVHEADCIADPADRAREIDNLGDAILNRNRMIFDSGVMNQAFPINRPIGGRWFDELGWDAADLERCSG